MGVALIIFPCLSKVFIETPPLCLVSVLQGHMVKRSGETLKYDFHWKILVDIWDNTLMDFYWKVLTALLDNTLLDFHQKISSSLWGNTLLYFHQKIIAILRGNTL